MSDSSRLRRRGVWTVVTPFGEVRTFHELSRLREAMAKELDDDAPGPSGPDSDPAPLSGRDLVVLAAPVAEPSTAAQPAVAASLPPMRPRMRSIPPPLPTHPFKLSPSLQPPSPDQVGREALSIAPAPAPEQESAFPLGHRPAAQQPFAVAPSMQPPGLGPAVTTTANGAASAEEAPVPLGEPPGDESSGVATPEEVTKRTLRPRVVRRNSEPVDSSAYVRAAPSRSVMVGGVVGLAAVLLVGMYVLMNERSENGSAGPAVVVAPRTPALEVTTGVSPATAPTAQTPPADTVAAVAPPSSSPAASSSAAPGGSPASALPVPSSTVPSTAIATGPATTPTTTPAVAPAPAPVAVTEPTAPAASAGAPVSAAATRRSRDLARAEAKYRALLASNPSDVESLAALGDTLRGLGNQTEALTMYKRALSFSPAYQPALLGVADALWETGDHDGARKHYAEVVDRFPAEAVPARARERSTP